MPSELKSDTFLFSFEKQFERVQECKCNAGFLISKRGCFYDWISQQTEFEMWSQKSNSFRTDWIHQWISKLKDFF